MLPNYFGEFSVAWTFWCSESSLLVVTSMAHHLIQKYILDQIFSPAQFSSACIRTVFQRNIFLLLQISFLFYYLYLFIFSLCANIIQ